MCVSTIVDHKIVMTIDASIGTFIACERKVSEYLLMVQCTRTLWSRAFHYTITVHYKLSYNNCDIPNHHNYLLGRSPCAKCSICTVCAKCAYVPPPPPRVFGGVFGPFSLPPYCDSHSHSHTLIHTYILPTVYTHLYIECLFLINFLINRNIDA